MGKLFRIISTKREFYLLIFIVIVIVYTALKTDCFLSIENIRAFMLTISVNGIVAAGVTILFISGGFDLSIGTVMATLGVILGILLGNNVPVVLAIIIVLAIGTFIGFTIGLFVAKINLNPLIATLAYYFIFHGLAYILGLGSKVRRGLGTPYFAGFPDSFTLIAGRTLWGIEYIAYYAVIIVLVVHYLSRNNVFFRQNFYIGGNEEAAKIAGIKVNLLKIFNYAFVTFMVTIATILRASRVGGTGSGLGGGPYYALIITAGVIIGGASLEGGSGSVIGSFLGITLIALIYNALTMLGIVLFYNDLFIAAILFLAILADNFMKKYSAKKVIKLSNEVQI